MRIAVIGTGGVGGYFGGRLAASGVDVSFVARGAHLAAMKTHGLRILSPLGNLQVRPIQAADHPAAIGPVDIVFFTVKLYDTDQAAAMVPALMGPSTLVVSFQNGIEAIDLLTRALGPSHVAGGTTYVSAIIDEPGVIRHTAMNRLLFGPLDPSQRERLAALRDVCVGAGIETTLSDRILVEIWAKFVRLTVFSGMTALTRQPIGPVVTDPDLLAMTRQALTESMAVARARQVSLPDATFDEILASLKALPAETKSSLLGDLERGRRLELPWLSGAVARLGRELGVPTPTHEFIATALKPYVHGVTPA